MSIVIEIHIRHFNKFIPYKYICTGYLQHATRRPRVLERVLPADEEQVHAGPAHLRQHGHPLPSHAHQRYVVKLSLLCELIVTAKF